MMKNTVGSFLLGNPVVLEYLYITGVYSLQCFSNRVA